MSLSASPSKPTRFHLIGPFSATLRATELADGRDLPERLFASLLTQGPDLHGRGFMESARTSGERRPVLWRRVDSKALVIPHSFSFKIPGSGLVEQLGLFDGDDRLMFYGPLKSQRQAVERPELFEFPEGSVRLMHSKPMAP